MTEANVTQLIQVSFFAILLLIAVWGITRTDKGK